MRERLLFLALASSNSQLAAISQTKSQLLWNDRRLLSLQKRPLGSHPVNLWNDAFRGQEEIALNARESG